jgi:hypothetical protein
MSQLIEKLIFIYNADSGLPAAMLDSAKKLFRLEACGLCTITHGLLKEKKQWKDCQTQFNLPIDYFHKDDLPNNIKEIVGNNLPSILAQISTKYIVLLNHKEINSCKGNVANLEIKLKESIKKNNLSY